MMKLFWEQSRCVHICSIQESNEITDNLRQEIWQQFSMLEERKNDWQSIL